MLYLALLCSCVSPIYTDYDREALSKFDQYNCFEIISNEGQKVDKDLVLSPLVDRRIERELNSVLKTHGFTDQCALPDFRVRYQTVKRTINRLNNFGSGTFHPHRYGYPVFGSYPNFYMDHYEEGTFMVDIIDAQSNEIVWRGAYVRRLGLKAPTDMEIREMLEEILDRFPPTEEN